MLKLRNSLARDYIIPLCPQEVTGKIVLLFLVFMDLFIKKRVNVELHIKHSPIFDLLEINVNPFAFQEPSYPYFQAMSSLWLHSLGIGSRIVKMIKYLENKVSEENQDFSSF